MKKKWFKYPGYRLTLVILVFAALIVLVFIYYNHRVRVIENTLKKNFVSNKTDKLY